MRINVIEKRSCVRCHENKFPILFYKNPRTICKKCVKQSAAEWAKSNRGRRKEIEKSWRANNKDKEHFRQIEYRKGKGISKYLCNLAKRRSARCGIEFSLNPEDIVVPTVCPLLGIKIDPFHEKQDYHPSLDRINSKVGYTKLNTLVVSFRANRLKGDATSEELMLLASNLKKIEGV